MGGKKDAPVDAANVAAEATREGLGELRRQFDLSRSDVKQSEALARQYIQPFFQQGVGGLQRFVGSTTPEGLGANLGRIFEGGALDPLIEERTRAVQGQLASTGLSRSGAALEEAARIPTELGLQVEQLLTGRSQDLANIGLGAATGTANISQGAGQSLAGLSQSFGQGVLGAQQGIGETLGQGIIGRGQAQAGFGQGILNAATAAATAPILAGGGTILGLALSDPRLKTNVVKVGEINDLGVYQWDWKPELEGMAVAETSTLGFMADEVEEKYPEYVTEFGGFRCIAYAPLINLLEHNIEEYYGVAA